jgi:hypothetical protein
MKKKIELYYEYLIAVPYIQLIPACQEASVVIRVLKFA